VGQKHVAAIPILFEGLLDAIELTPNPLDAVEELLLVVGGVGHFG